MSRDYLTRTVGISLLITVTVFIAGWMHVQRARLSPTTATLPTLNVTPTLQRFNASTFYLPDEALLGFVEISAGSFVMGNDATLDRSAYANERWSATQAQGTVMLPTFYISRYEVTVAQFREFVAATGYISGRSALQTAADNPITDVSWGDALAYARWLTTALQQSTQTPTPLLALLKDGWRITLPSEAQWEKAARGSDGRIYPWGNSPSHTFANFGSSNATQVGSFACNECAFGLADMSGNVWELTLSPYRAYPYSDVSADQHSDALYVMRGGAFNESETNIRSTIRGGIDPGARRNFIGFRLALTQ